MCATGVTVRLSLAFCAWLAMMLPASGWAETYRLGIFAYRPKPVMAQKYQMLGVYLNGALSPGDTLETVYLDMDELERELTAGRLDFVFTNPVHYLMLLKRHHLSGAIATLQALENGVITDKLGGVVLARADRADLQRLEDLAGKRIAIPGKKFLGGYQAQAFELLQLGIRLPRDAELIEMGGHDQVVEAVLAGQADVGFVRTGILEALQAEGKLAPGALKVVGARSHPGFPYAVSTRLYPEWAFVALPHVPEPTLKRIARALLFLSPDMPAAQAAGIAGFTIPGDYQVIKELARSLRLPPYERVDFDLTDVWQRYRLAIFVVLLLLTVIGMLGLRLVFAYRQLDDSRRRLTMTVDGARLGTWDYEIDTATLRGNARLSEMLGFAPGEIGTNLAAWNALVHPDDLPRVREAMAAHLDGRESFYRCELRMQHKSGRWVWILAAGQIVDRHRDGAPRIVSGIHIDITDLKETAQKLAQREARLQLLIESMSDVVMVLDTSGNVIECYWPQYLPLPRADAPCCVSGQPCVEVVPAAFRKEIDELIVACLEQPERPLRREFAWPLSDHRVLWFLASFCALRQQGEKWPQGFLLVARDITRRKEEELDLVHTRHELEKLARRNQMLLDAAGEGIYGVDMQGNITFINPSALAMLGLTEEEALGRNAHALFHGRSPDGSDDSVENCPLHRALRDGQRHEGDEVFLRKHGEPFFVHMVCTPICEDGRQLGAESVFFDISARKAMEAELVRLATTDALTGLSNRRHFLVQAEEALARLQRLGHEAALLMIDLDHFKRINDTWGHAAGDAVLAAFAETLRGSLRKVDHAGRIGGEEFAVLLEGCGLTSAKQYAERLLQEVQSRYVPLDEEQIRFTISIGITPLLPEDRSPDAAMRRADAALYRAKALGRNRVEIEPPPASACVQAQGRPACGASPGAQG